MYLSKSVLKANLFIYNLHVGSKLNLNQQLMSTDKWSHHHNQDREAFHPSLLREFPHHWPQTTVDLFSITAD